MALAGKKHRDYLCDVCSTRIGKRGFVVLVRGHVAMAKCRAHRDARIPGWLAR